MRPVAFHEGRTRLHPAVRRLLLAHWHDPAVRAGLRRWLTAASGPPTKRTAQGVQEAAGGSDAPAVVLVDPVNQEATCTRRPSSSARISR